MNAIAQQNNDDFINVSYLTSICLLQFIIDPTIAVTQGKVVEEKDLSLLNQIEQAIYKKDRIFNIIYKDLMRSDEIAIALKIQLITEILLQTDSFKQITKQRVGQFNKTLMMLLQEHQMRFLLGPRVIQLLQLLITKCPKAKKIQGNKAFIDAAKEFLRGYFKQLDLNVESDKENIQRLMNFSKSLIQNSDDYNNLLDEFKLDKLVIQLVSKECFSNFIT
ncbi:UNKNOWN [Stylonychia lemnae]|uniref:Uncharacterized protein n=1 Tax=Stylonychia lemnae TaxID=5949 RepID=A0A078AIJ7_STYLE|nr:UNKNOWN [Stylonychia lemnae]|eukprot:CDW81317.1 UNKNOWN [Stylonychia lemnae]